ncbi:MAG: glutathione S-transferase family protein [Caulobacteraceae bacterium]|nr:glutathione S-transferase family protein [Caulobacteraceae bacterium]
MTLTVFGDSTSGNCLKVKWILDLLEIDYQWTEIDVRSGETRQAPFLTLNPSGQVPAVRLADGRTLAQSNAILTYFGEGTRLIPKDKFDRARMFEWLFWEQYSHEPYIAVRRFQLAYLKKRPEDLSPHLKERGDAALARMETGLENREWLAGTDLSLADIALAAYTRMAGDGGFELADYPRVCAWVDRVEAALGLDASSRRCVPA